MAITIVDKLEHLTKEEILELFDYRIKRLENSPKEFVYNGNSIRSKQEVLELYYHCRALYIKTNGLDKEIPN